MAGNPWLTGLLIAGIPALIAGLMVRRKTAAESTDFISQAAERMLKAATDRIAALELRLTAAEAEAAAAKTEAAKCRVAERASHDRISVLERQVEDLLKLLDAKKGTK